MAGVRRPARRARAEPVEPARVCAQTAFDPKGAPVAATFDFKKEYRDLYLPTAEPALADVPAMTFAAVAGTGDPNEEGGAYAQALALLYGFSYTAKMLKMGPWQPEGYFDFVVPPLEGLWWGASGAFDGANVADKARLSWVSLIRQPDFVTPETFERVCTLLGKKKPGLADALARGDLHLVRFAEGPCAQVMHRGPYDDEPATVSWLAAFVEEQGLACDIADAAELDAPTVLAALDADGGVPGIRLHHEIYLGDPRRTRPENLKTVIRHPVAPAGPNRRDPETKGVSPCL